MSILKIARMGHPALRSVAQPVADPTAPEIRKLVEDMIETLEDIGGAGLAAPQVHVPLRVVIFRVRPERCSGSPGDEPVELTALINPTWEPVGDTIKVDWEGCLSVPGLRGAVPRHASVRYSAWTLDGKRINRSAVGFHAMAIQHEIDHLDGVLYPQRMSNLGLLGFSEELLKYPLEPG